MNLLFLTQLFYPHVGGVEKHVFEIAKKLKNSPELLKKVNASEGIKIKILTTGFNKNLKDKEIINGIEIYRFYQPKIKYFGLVYTWFWIFKNINLIIQSDIVHIHDVFIWYLPFRFLFPRKKVYITFHGWEGKYPISWVSILQKKIANKFSYGSIAVGKYINKYYGIKANIITYGAVNVYGGSFKKEKENIILFVGRLDKNTLLPVFLKMLKNFSEFFIKFKLKVEFCGDGELRKFCEKYGRVYGWHNPENLFKKAKYVFGPGYLTTLEALSYRCLVFSVYKNPIQRDIFRTSPFKKYIFLTNDPIKITQKIEFYEKNPKMRKIIAERGFKWVKNQTWEALERKYLKLWENRI